MKQISLLPAGCQPWSTEVCASSPAGDRFAYCATLAIYVYQLDKVHNEFRLSAIFTEHEKTISSIAWSPHNPDILASAGSDNRVIVWNVPVQQVIQCLENTKQAPNCLGWCPHERGSLAFTCGRGPLYTWNFSHGGAGLTVNKDAQSFSSDVCQFRWHPQKAGRVAFGHMDGSLSYFTPGQKSQKHILRPENLEGSDEEDPVADIQWDPLSISYLLVANQHFGVRMIDSEALTVISTFALPSAAASVHTISWIPSAPGIFITGDTNVGVIRIWNVSKTTPLDNIKIKKYGFHALHVIGASRGGNWPAEPAERSTSQQSSTTSTSMAATPKSNYTNVRGYTLPPGHAVCTFLDGGVGLYDLGKRKWVFLRDLGHVETIFDCKFKPDNPDLLATASFDGTIKVWDVNSLTAESTSPGNEGVIYSLSWAPADLNCIAAATSRHGAFIWDVMKGKIIKRFKEHGQSSIFSISWNQKDSRRIATCGSDCYCIIRNVDGNLIQKYKHPSSVFGCDWSMNNKDMIATGCEDGNVRVFYIPTSSDQPLKVFSGHKAKVFHVRWSPLREGILCSGSDDKTIRVWDYTQDACINILDGHKGPVRGLLWNPELPYLLISGSWDFSIRVWDVRDGACIDVVLDHGADVYGLTTHPQRPLTLASCSRDSTVRIWSLSPLVTSLHMGILAGRPVSQIVTNATDHSGTTGTHLLVGKKSRDLSQKVSNLCSGTEEGSSWTLQLFSEFFSPPGGARNLWELVDVLNGRDDRFLSSHYSKGIMHTKHIIKFKASEANQLEMARVSKYGMGVGSQNREEKLRAAAEIHIRIGNIERYCELMVEVGEWEKALAVAPGVSMEYWKNLTQRRAQYLMQEEMDSCSAYYIASGQAQELAAYYQAHGQLEDALLVAQVAAEANGQLAKAHRAHPSLSGSNNINGLDAVDNGGSSDYQQLVHDVSSKMADWHFLKGSPVLAACCHLSVGDTELALSKLIRGNELELAVSVGRVLKGDSHQKLVRVATEFLSRRCEKLSNWDLAVDLLHTIEECGPALVRLCARCTGSAAEINDLHRKAGLPSMEECLKTAEKLKVKADVEETVKYYLLSTTPELALDFGLDCIKSKLKQPDWTLKDISTLVDLLGCIRTEKLQQEKFDKQKQQLLALSSYTGALTAIRRHYYTIVPRLFDLTRELLEQGGADIPLEKKLVSIELEAWKAFQNHNAGSGEQKRTYERLLAKAGPRGETELDAGLDLVTGSHLPSHSDVHHSYFNGSRIQGPVFFLEDGKQAISLNDALMWAKVNPFSPLSSGEKINPF